MKILDRYRGFALDLDGTVYLGDALLPGAQQTIEAIRASGRPLVYLTNKPLEPSTEYAAKLTRLGLPTTGDEVISSLDAMVDYLATHHPAATIYCVSEPLVEKVLGEAGHQIVAQPAAASARVVVVSFDRTFDYQKLLAAYTAVRAGAVLVATNPDRFCPTPDGGLPDCAAMLAAIEAATGTVAEAIVGKPSAAMAAAVMRRLAVRPAEILMVGDRSETDVRLALKAGFASALISPSGAVVAESTENMPTYRIEDLGGLLKEHHLRPESEV